MSGRLIALAALLSAAVACSPETPADQALRMHVLSRTGYGPDAWSQARIDALGIEAYIQEQLHPDALAENPQLEAQLAALPSLELGLYQILALYQDEPFQPLIEVTAAKMLRSIYGRRQLEQVLTDFWFDHFNVFGADGVTNFAMGPYERIAIRPHVLGRFEDMLYAVARNPAMLYYLDNFASTKEGFEFEGELRGLNENYARELLELHTLSVEADYEQADVIEVARAFSGWTFLPPELAFLAGPDGFFFWPEAHDQEPKSIMGTLELPAGQGMEDGLAVIAFLASHPSTAHFLCTKLVQRFVDEAAPPALVDECSADYLASDGDLGVVMETILLSDDFLGEDHIGAKVKRPVHFLSSLMRATEATPDPETFTGLVYALGLLGEFPYQAHPPTGFPDVSAHWANGGTLLTRFNLNTAITFADAELGIEWGVGAQSPEGIVDGLSAKLLPAGLDDASRDAIVAYLETLNGWPQPARVREAAALVLSSPDFMRH